MNRDVADTLRSIVAAVGAAAVSLGWITAEDSASAVGAVTAIGGAIATLAAVGYTILRAVGLLKPAQPEEPPVK